jgi:hypothetical protein
VTRFGRISAKGKLQACYQRSSFGNHERSVALCHFCHDEFGYVDF